MNDIIVTSLITGILTGGVFGFIEFLISRKDTLKKSMRAVLKDRLMFLAIKYTERGYIRTHELETYAEMYSCYHELGGNSFIEAEYDSVCELPRQDK